MKKLFLLMLMCPAMLPAQSKITITEFSVMRGSPATVTFTVNWNKEKIDSAWVFVDYNDSGTMTRLPLTDVTASTGRAHMVPGNDRGAWVVADVSGAFSATVQLVTTCRDARPCVPTGACVYAIDYPPVGEYTAVDVIKFTGTPPFYLDFDNDSPDTVSTKDAQGLYTYNPVSKKLKSFTDATGAPGIFLCALPVAQTLTVSAAGYCADAAGVQFALSGTEIGVTYQLIKDNTTVAATLTTTGGAATFSGAHHSGMYSAKTAAGAYCEVQMSGTHTVSVYAVPGAPTMSGPSTACVSTTISASPGSGGDGIRWTDNSSTTQSRTVTASGNYTAVTTHSDGCTSSSQDISVNIYGPGTADGSDATCGCSSGLIDCSGTCRTNANYTAPSGVCAPICGTAYTTLHAPCGAVLNPTASTYTEPACLSGCCTHHKYTIGSTTQYYACKATDERAAAQCTGTLVKAGYETTTDPGSVYCTGTYQCCY